MKTGMIKHIFALVQSSSSGRLSATALSALPSPVPECEWAIDHRPLAGINQSV